jgi:WD40 repeat protein
MKAHTKAFILAGYLTLGFALSSCEIEDEYSKPDQSEQLGTKIYKGTNPPAALLWSKNTNEVIVVNTDGIVAIDPQSKKVRKLPFDASYFTTQSAWIVENTIYQVSTNGGVSGIDLTTLSYKGTLVDSAYFHVYSSPFTTTHFAYIKYRPEEYLPSIFLYDLSSHQEMYIGTGLPYVFSPDGSQLIFSNNTEFFVYNLTTKATTALNFNEDNGPNIIKWTTDGILSFHHQGESIMARNESNGMIIGEWKCAEGLYGSAISPSGKHIITKKMDCLQKDNTSGYCQYGKLEHSIVDIYANVEVPVVYTVSSYINLRAFSPDEKSFAFTTYENNVYISDIQN